MRARDPRWLALLAPLLLAAEPVPPQPVPPQKPSPETAAPAPAAQEADAETSADAAPTGDGAGGPTEALDMEARRAALRLLESDVAAKLQELAQLQTAALAKLEEQKASASKAAIAPGDSGDVKKLVALYQAMKPKNAARLLEQLPLSVSCSVLGTMKARPAGKIMNEMEPKLAAQISKRLAERGS